MPRSKKSSQRRRSDPNQAPENNSLGGMQFEQENEDHSQQEKQSKQQKAYNL